MNPKLEVRPAECCMYCAHCYIVPSEEGRLTGYYCNVNKDQQDTVRWYLKNGIAPYKVCDKFKSEIKNE